MHSLRILQAYWMIFIYALICKHGYSKPFHFSFKRSGPVSRLTKNYLMLKAKLALCFVICDFFHSPSFCHYFRKWKGMGFAVVKLVGRFVHEQMRNLKGIACRIVGDQRVTQTDRNCKNVELILILSFFQMAIKFFNWKSPHSRNCQLVMELKTENQAKDSVRLRPCKQCCSKHHSYTMIIIHTLKDKSVPMFYQNIT